ncbi:MAG: hypothetical protein CMF42_02225 [Legionellales bacterium]|nr:hypothetical protein [Legionellales bacterium]
MKCLSIFAIVCLPRYTILILYLKYFVDTILKYLSICKSNKGIYLMVFDAKIINNLSKLAFIDLSDHEIVSLTDDFNRIVDMIDSISDIDLCVDDIDAKTGPSAPLRNDIIEHTPFVDQIKSFSQFDENLNSFVVPKVVDKN